MLTEKDLQRIEDYVAQLDDNELAILACFVSREITKRPAYADKTPEDPPEARPHDP